MRVRGGEKGRCSCPQAGSGSDKMHKSQSTLRSASSLRTALCVRVCVRAVCSAVQCSLFTLYVRLCGGCGVLNDNHLFHKGSIEHPHPLTGFHEKVAQLRLRGKQPMRLHRLLLYQRLDLQRHNRRQSYV